jgi:hypothetical protein
VDHGVAHACQQPLLEKPGKTHDPAHNDQLWRATSEYFAVSVLSLTDDSQIGANLRFCADEENRADFDQCS